jgi:hypothetical protein
MRVDATIQRQAELLESIDAMAPVTNRENLEARIARAAPGDEPGYRAAVYAGVVDDLVNRAVAQDDRAGVPENVIEADARARVVGWLRSPAVTR